jgi:hypothetical protein
MATDTERASWREACDMAGPARMRLRLEHRRNEFSPEHACEIDSWLLDKEKELSEKDKEALTIKTPRVNTARDWTIVAAWAGIVATIGSAIIAWPVLVTGSWCAIDAHVGGLVRQNFPDDGPIKRSGAHSTFPIFEVCAPRHELTMISEISGRPFRTRPAYR